MSHRHRSLQSTPLCNQRHSPFQCYMHVSTSDALFWLFHRHSEIRHSLGKLCKSCLSLTRHFSLTRLELLNTPMSLSRDLSTEAQTHQRILWLLSYEQRVQGEGQHTCCVSFRSHSCLQKGLSCIHSLWSKLMFVYRDCKAGELESGNVLQYYLWSPS